MTAERVGGSDVLVAGLRLKPDLAAVVLGMSVALSMVAGALFTAGIAGIEFRVSTPEKMAAAVIPAAIALILTAFFCGGWAYSARRARGHEF